MSQYQEKKTKVTNLMFAGVGGGLLIFVIGLLAKSTNISVLGIIGSATSGGVGQIMIQNTKKLRTDEEIFAEKRQELEKAISESQNRANHIYRLDYFDIDRNKPDFINFNAYGFTFSDGITKASEFQIIEKEKIYNTRTIKEVSRTTKTKVYYKEKQEKYIDKVRFEIHYNNLLIHARTTYQQYENFVAEYKAGQTRRNSVVNLEYEYEMLLSQNNNQTPHVNGNQSKVFPQPNLSTRNTQQQPSNKNQIKILNNKYKIIKQIGEGGFGITYLVEDTTTNIKNLLVAKCQKLTDDKTKNYLLIDRFEQEAAILQRVGNAHGQIPSLFDYFDYKGNFYLIQEFIRGKTLSDIAISIFKENYVFSERKASAIILSLLEVIQHIHNQGLIHRDIKPQNIILREGDDKPVLIDFGLSKQLTEENVMQTGTKAGTVGYCPIEQQMGQAFFQSDLYAVGMVMLLLTTGRKPDTLEFNDQFEADLNWTEESLSKPLFNWIKKAIQCYPQNRFSSAEEMRQKLMDIFNQEYLMRGVEIAEQVYQNQIADMEQEIDKLLRGIEQPGRSGHILGKIPYSIDNLNHDSGAKRKQNQQFMPIITTQKEIDAYNVVKRILEKEGLDPNQLEITDSVEYCDIHVRNQPQAIVVRLYFNDENNLAFSIPQSNGYEEHFQINTLRGISSKKDLIISHFQALIQKIGGVNIVKSTSPHSNINQNSGQIDDLQRREIFPIIAAAIQDRFGNEFEIINLSFEETTNKFYGQFVGLGLQTGCIFDFNLLPNKKGDWILSYQVNLENLKTLQEAEQAEISQENELAKQGIYRVGWLQRNFDSFKAAKEHFNIAAKSWQKLAERLNERKI